MALIDVILESTIPDMDEFVTSLARRICAIPFRSSNAACAKIEANDVKLLSKEYKVHRAKKVSLFPYARKICFTRENLSQIGAPKAQKITRGKGARVAVIDTGVDYTHSELSECFESGYDFISKTNDGMDYHGHGTHVAGIIAGKTTGISNECSLFSLRVLDERGTGSEVNIIRALEWAVDNHIDICNLSLGSKHPSMFEKRAVNYAISNGVTLCAAAGNSGKREYNYPASYTGMISVAAVDGENNHANFSTINDKLTISAPGVMIESTYLDGSYRRFSGTSMATPHVTGTLALKKSLGKLTPQKAKEVATATALHLGDRNKYGSGLIRADKAVASSSFLQIIDRALAEIL